MDATLLDENGKDVAAAVEFDHTPAEAQALLRQWRRPMDELGDREADSAWDWIREFRIAQFGRRSPCFVAVKARNRLQGLMLTERAGMKTHLKPYRPLLYVPFLATAPWNREVDLPPRLRPHGRLRGTGRLLMQAAVQLARQAGHSGRVGLHSKEQALPFYLQKCHLVYIGSHCRVPDQGLPWVEATRTTADFFTSPPGHW